MSFSTAMKLRIKWLRVTLPQNGGPRARSVLLGLARTPAEERIAEPLLELMLAEETFVMYGERKAATYGRPRVRRS
jgi:hypothetical protein